MLNTCTNNYGRDCCTADNSEASVNAAALVLLWPLMMTVMVD